MPEIHEVLSKILANQDKIIALLEKGKPSSDTRDTPPKTGTGG